MSTAGRLQDALWDLLIGYDMGNGEHVPGKLADLDRDRVSALIDDIGDVVYPFTIPAPVHQGESAIQKEGE